MAKGAAVRVLNGGIIFGERGPLWLAVILVITLYLSRSALAGVAGIALAIWLFARCWAGYCQRGLKLTERVSAREVFPGEAVTLEVDIQNGSRLPLAWLELEFGGAAPEKQLVAGMGWIGGKKGTTFRCQQQLLARGIYRVGVTKTRSGDPFALFCSELSLPAAAEVIVYPRWLAFDWQRLGSKHPNGTIADKNCLFEDPVLLAGVRNYLPSDPLRRVNWAASARFQSLQSNLWEGKAATFCHILFLSESLEWVDWPRDKVLLAWELLLSSIASYAAALTEAHQEWTFLADLLSEKQRLTQLKHTNPYTQLKQLLGILAGLNLHNLREERAAVFEEMVTGAGHDLAVFAFAYTPEVIKRRNFYLKFRKVTWFVLGTTEVSPSEKVQIVPLLPNWFQDESLEEKFLGR